MSAERVAAKRVEPSEQVTCALRALQQSTKKLEEVLECASFDPGFHHVVRLYVRPMLEQSQGLERALKAELRDVRVI